MMKFQVSDYCVLTKIFDSDKEIKNTSASGLIVSNQLKPNANHCGIGIAQSVGKKVRWIKEGDMILFSWIVEDQEERFLGRDDDGEYRIVKDGEIGGQIYGVVKNYTDGRQSRIIPKRYYALCEPHHTILNKTNAIFQVPIAGLNPRDEAAKKMGLAVGDWIVCEPYSAKAISINRQIFWFVFLENIYGVNEGRHELAIQRKYVSPHLRLASRKNKELLN